MGKTVEKKFKEQKDEQYLKCEFTREEIENMSYDLAQKISELKQKEANKKEVVKSLDSEIATLEAHIGSLATKVKDRYEFRNVPVIITFDYVGKEKRYTRQDTFEEYRKSPLVGHELQTTFLEDEES